MLISLLLSQGGPGFPLKDSKATHALNVHLAPMVISSGLAVTFADVTSKADRMSLVVKVIKGSNVLSLRESIDSVSTRYPLQMEELDKGMLGVHNTTQQVRKCLYSASTLSVKLRHCPSADEPRCVSQGTQQVVHFIACNGSASPHSAPRPWLDRGTPGVWAWGTFPGACGSPVCFGA